MRIASSAAVTPGAIKPSEYAGQVRTTNYIGAIQVHQPGAQAFVVEVLSGGGVVRPHFHPMRQFQVIASGSGRLGKQQVNQLSFHYADCFTPYGPIVADDSGISFFTLRPQSSVGTFYMPGSRDKMERKPGRNMVAHLRSDAGKTGSEPEVLIERQADGLAAVGCHLGPHMQVRGLESTGAGQYYLVGAGSLVSEGTSLPKNSLIWIDPNEPAPMIQAGAEGATVLVLQFPIDTAGAAQA